MNNLSYTLNLFCSTERTVLKKPVLVDDKIYVSNSWILGVFPLSVFKSLGISKEDLHKELNYVPSTEKTPDFTRIPSEKLIGTQDVVFTYDTILDYANLYTSHNHSCKDCGGYGYVDYTYESLSGESFTKEEVCPVCGGSGTIDKGIVSEIYKNYPIESSYFYRLKLVMDFFKKREVRVFPTTENFVRLDFGDFYFIVAKSLTIVETLTLKKSPKSYIVTYQEPSSVTNKSIKIVAYVKESVKEIFTDVCPEGVITMIEESKN